jgi:hypothetical protein
MRSPAKKGVPTSDVESQYDAYLLKERGLSRSTRNLHHHVVHRFCRRAFPAGTLIGAGSASAISCSFLRASLRDCAIGRLRQLG